MRLDRGLFTCGYLSIFADIDANGNPFSPPNIKKTALQSGFYFFSPEIPPILLYFIQNLQSTFLFAGVKMRIYLPCGLHIGVS